MHKLKAEVISCLNMGLNPTVIGFQDDGLFYLFDNLLKGEQQSSGYDPTFTFVHVSANNSEESIAEAIEQEINKLLTVDQFPGDTIFDTINNGIEVVCVIDNLAFVEDVKSLSESCDVLIKKYREKLKFVYIVEEPTLIEKYKSKIPVTSTLFETIIYQEIGKYWEAKDLYDFLHTQFKQDLSPEEIYEISLKSGNHFGTFKRLYKDKVLNMNTTERFISMLSESFNKSVLTTFKKSLNDQDLTEDEEVIFNVYQKVGFFKGEEIAIPLLSEYILNSKIKESSEINENVKFNDLQLNELSKTEREITEFLMKSTEIVSKEKIGEIIWKDKIDSNYSVWAVDQRIARLRRKFMDLGMDIDIQTIYGKGFKLVKIEKKI